MVSRSQSVIGIPAYTESLWQLLLCLEKQHDQTHLRFGARITFPFMHCDHRHHYPVAAVSAVCDSEHGVIITHTALSLLRHRGCLPDHYLDTIVTDRHHNHHALDQLIQLLNQHWLQLAYRAWKSTLPGQQFALQPKNNALIKIVTALSRHHYTPTQHTPAVQASLLGYLGILTQNPTSAPQLRYLLQHYFQLPVTITQHLGQWIILHAVNVSYLGRQYNQLGINANIGQCYWDMSHHIALQLGPLTAAQFDYFLPERRGRSTLHAVLALLLPVTLTYTITLTIATDAIIRLRLNRPQLRLGENTWLPATQADDYHTQHTRTHA